MKCSTKMYICVKANLPSHKSVAIAHGVLIAHIRFTGSPDYNSWIDDSFRKVVCEVTDEEFEKLKFESDRVIVTESALNHQEVAIVLCPREVWPDYIKELKLSQY